MLKFKTLLLREWMQHHRGWFILALVPLVIAALVLPFGTVQMDEPIRPAALALAGLGAYTVGVLVLAWFSVTIQTPGMARRDQQDRSIEFWVSLPVEHWQAVLATVAMHLLLMPLLVLALAFVGGQLVAVMLVIKLMGAAGLGDIAIGPWLMASVALLLRLVLGVAVCALWLAPLLLAGMAAAAWLKRWGVPVLAAAIGIGGGVLAKVYGNTIVFDVVNGLFVNALAALVPISRHDGALEDLAHLPDVLNQLPSWLMRDAGQMLADLLSPGFVGALVASAACVALLVLRRQRVA